MAEADNVRSWPSHTVELAGCRVIAGISLIVTVTVDGSLSQDVAVLVATDVVTVYSVVAFKTGVVNCALVLE